MPEEENARMSAEVYSDSWSITINFETGGVDSKRLYIFKHSLFFLIGLCILLRAYQSVSIEILSILTDSLFLFSFLGWSETATIFSIVPAPGDR
jgi:hypothetical protein